MSDQYTHSTPAGARPTINGVGLDQNRSDYRADPPSLVPSSQSGFSTGIMVALVFVIVAIIAATVFSNRDMFGIGNSVTPAAVSTDSAPADAGVDPVAPTPVPAQDPQPADAPADPVTPPVQSAPAQQPAVNP